MKSITWLDSRAASGWTAGGRQRRLSERTGDPLLPGRGIVMQNVGFQAEVQDRDIGESA